MLTLDHIHSLNNNWIDKLPNIDFKFPQHDLPAYDARRMSSSAASGVSSATDDSSRAGDKRPPSPDISPRPKRQRPTLSLDYHDNIHNNSDGQRTPESSSITDTAPSEKVQLPPIFSNFDASFSSHRRHDLDARRGSLPNLYSDSLSVSRARLSAPSSALARNWHPAWPSDSDASSPALSSYQFPPSDAPSDTDDRVSRPKLAADTQLGTLTASPPGTDGDYSPFPASGYSTSSSSAFPPTPLDAFARHQPYDAHGSNGDWTPPAIVRPSSTPGQISAPPPASAPSSPDRAPPAPLFPALAQPHMYGGAARISGHAHDQRKLFPPAAADPSPPINKQANGEEWFTPSGSFVLPPGAPSYPSNGNPSTSTSSAAASSSTALASPGGNNNNASTQASASSSTSPTIDAQSAPGGQGARPPRRRGKLPKPTTDFLKDWLHRHSDHPYPSEEEKKQLCNATGLSMSQVSNWMINARRRILAPANRAAQGPTTTLPFPSARSGGLSGHPPPLASLSGLSGLSPLSALSSPGGPLMGHNSYGQGGVDVTALRRASMPGPAPDHHLHLHGHGGHGHGGAYGAHHASLGGHGSGALGNGGHHGGLQLFNPNSLGLGVGMGGGEYMRGGQHHQQHHQQSHHHHQQQQQQQHHHQQQQPQHHQPHHHHQQQAHHDLLSLPRPLALHHSNSYSSSGSAGGVNGGLDYSSNAAGSRLSYSSHQQYVPLSAPAGYGGGGSGSAGSGSPGVSPRPGIQRGYTFPDSAGGHGAD